MLFGRMIVVIKKFTGKMVEISFPSTFVPGILLLLSRRNLLPWGRSDWVAYFVARDCFYGCARGSLKIDLLEKDAAVDGDDER